MKLLENRFYKQVVVGAISQVDDITAIKLNYRSRKIGFINVNDKTVEGLRYKNKNIFTVQFHPEACPGPQDSSLLFDKFIEMMGGKKNA